MPRLVVGEIIVVEIPIEACLTLRFKREEEPLLDLLQHIESHKHIFVELIVGLGFHHTAIQRALVSQPLRGETLIEVTVNFFEIAPKRKEPLFELGEMVVGEIVEERLEYILLLG